MEKISVIIPFYNAEKTLDRCLNSVLNQTYKNIEVVMINDGSTDGSLEIIKKYSATDNRIKLFGKDKNYGPAAARNTGLSKACGEYVKFVDADDNMIGDDAFEILYNAIKENDADMAVCKFVHPFFRQYVKSRVFDLENKRDLYEYYNDFFGSSMPWNRLFKRSVIQNKFDETLRFSEDELFNLANLKTMKKVVCIDKVLYNYFSAQSEVKEDNTSIIDSVGRSQENGGINKDSFWYRGDLQVLDKRRAVIENEFDKEDVDDYLYIRIIDYFFWELIIFYGIGLGRHVKFSEIFNVMREKDFIKGMQVKEKFGIRLKKFDDKVLAEKVDIFVDLYEKAHKDNLENKLNMEAYFVLLQLFCRIFCETDGVKLNTADNMAKALKELIDNSTKEAVYVNNIKIG